MTGRFRLTRAGAGAIVVAILMLAAGLLKTINLLILLGDLLLVLIAINAVIAWSITKSVRIAGVDACDHSAGASTARTMTLACDSPRSVMIRIGDSSPVHSETSTATLACLGENRIRIAFTPVRRGVFAVTSTFASGYPFGFVTHERTGPAVDALVVFPALGRVHLDRFRRWLHCGGSGDARSRRPALQSAGSQADCRGVRPYRGGDSPRHIHWRTSARRNELLVREYDSPDSLDLVIAIEAADENAISLVATLLQAWCRGEQSQHVTLLLPGAVAEGRASPALARRCLAALAGYQPGPIGLPPSLPRSIRLLVSPREVPQWQRMMPADAAAWYHAPSHD